MLVYVHTIVRVIVCGESKVILKKTQPFFQGFANSFYALEQVFNKFDLLVCIHTA